MKLVYLFIVLLFTIQIKSQQNYYIFIQNENAKPFYVKYKSKIYSSSSNGYLILSKLYIGQQNLKIGFPKSKLQEINFLLKIENEDLGYKLIEIKNNIFLENLKDKSIINEYKEVENTIKPDEIVKINKDSINKANDLSKVTIVNKNAAIKPIAMDTIVKNTKVLKTALPVIKKSNFGVDAIYYVNEGTNMDTIIIFIPTLKDATNNEIIEKNTTNKSDTIKKQEKEFLEFELKNNPEKKEINQTEIKKIDSNRMVKKLILFNSDCKRIATNDDYLVLRKKLAGMENIEDMYAVSLKIFKQKCFTVEQIRKTGVLFLNDADKFIFFKISYPYIYDSEYFKSLQGELKEMSSIQNFSNLLKK